MATVTIRYWAAAREAAGVAEEAIDAATLDDALTQIVTQRSPGPEAERLRTVLAGSSFLVNGDPAGKRTAAAALVLPDAAVVEVLPAFAGGLPGRRGTPGSLAGWAVRLGLRHTGEVFLRVLACARCGADAHE